MASLLEAWRSLPDLSAHFVELKRIAMMRAPLRSEGEISFIAGATGVLVRETTSPSRSRVRVSASELVIQEGGRQEVIALGSNAAVRGFVDTFREILAGDLTALNARYTIMLGPGSHGDWDMRLDPRDPQLARFLRELHITGSGLSIHGMRMIEQNGDVTETVFTNVRAPRNFTAAERAAVARR